MIVTTAISAMMLHIQLPFIVLFPIFQAIRVARKLANEPPIISIGPSPPKKFEITVPVVIPMIAGQPKIIESGNIASATLTVPCLSG